MSSNQLPKSEGRQECQERNFEHHINNQIAQRIVKTCFINKTCIVLTIKSLNITVITKKKDYSTSSCNMHKVQCYVTTMLDLQIHTHSYHRMPHIFRIILYATTSMCHTYSEYFCTSQSKQQKFHIKLQHAKVKGQKEAKNERKNSEVEK